VAGPEAVDLEGFGLVAPWASAQAATGNRVTLGLGPCPVRRFAEAGATEFVLFPYGPAADRSRTVAVLADLAREAR
jgi:hypothetical protein